MQVVVCASGFEDSIRAPPLLLRFASPGKIALFRFVNLPYHWKPAKTLLCTCTPPGVMPDFPLPYQLRAELNLKISSSRRHTYLLNFALIS